MFVKNGFKMTDEKEKGIACRGEQERGQSQEY